MISAPLTENEFERQAWLDELEILDSAEEQAYDDLTALAAMICGTPIALVSLIDNERQWFKSHHGLEARETPRDVAFCAHAIHGNELFVVEDALKDQRFHDNPLVSGAPEVKFYAGAPLVLSDNIRLGTLCVIDNHPRTLSAEQKTALEALARQVVSHLELRLKLRTLEALDASKDAFVSMVSHELRTPLTSLNGALRLIDRKVAGQFDEQSRDLISISIRNSERLMNIVNDILDVAGLNSGHFELDSGPVDVGELVNKAVEFNIGYCQQCGCNLVADTSGLDRHLTLNADEQRLLQVITNLVSNAAKFTHSGDTIELTAGIDSDAVTFSVIDHGPGIPVEQRAQLFKAFEQGGSGCNSKLPGTGLGLHICKQIIELHRGHISYESVPGKITRFYFRLPV